MFRRKNDIHLEGKVFHIKGNIADGATASIFKIKGKGKEVFALKRVIASEEEQQNAIKDEIKTLVTLGGGNNPNIIQLIGHDRKGSTFFLMFPLFERNTRDEDEERK